VAEGVRAFPTREALLAAVFQAKLDSAERVLDEARLVEAPVAVALHRYVEGIVPVSREWPVDVRRMMREDPAAGVRREEQSSRLDRFVQRAADEGLLRADVPVAWARAMLDHLVDTAAHQFPLLTPLRPPISSSTPCSTASDDSPRVRGGAGNMCASRAELQGQALPSHTPRPSARALLYGKAARVVKV
jgi:hypothetical protein